MKWLMILLLSASAQIAFAGSYKKWVDEEGKVHYGDRPPPAVVVEKVQVESDISETRVQEASQRKREMIRERDKYEAAEKRAEAYRRASSQSQSVPRAPSHPSPSPLAEDRVAEARRRCKETRGVDCDTRKFLDAAHPASASQQAAAREERARRARENYWR